MTYLHLTGCLAWCQIIELCILCHYTTDMSSFSEYNFKINALNLLLKKNLIRLWLNLQSILTFCWVNGYFVRYTDFNGIKF